MENEAGGIANVGCIDKDLRNVERDLQKEIKGHDADMLLEYFHSEKEKNPSFCFEVDKDEENKFSHCFWVDSTARKAYFFFGDVVAFDTTYNTNKYSMIFAPFVGVNHHNQTIVFGCGFLSDEKTESFIWLFEQWLKAMPSGPPQLIITDQDQAISKAIAQWVPAFCMHIFSAGMSSSQRVESGHSFFKKYVSKRNSFWDFVTRFERALGHQRHKELVSDHVDVNEVPKLRTLFPIE
ncbi:protein FAR1-RELATED SEQUENCE 5-like [Malus domestica]|uniref:protein FAR1-RELATED SEQUENCE 5-like n=1 Tax=Malus domestica TaxID=3750 RepID=UPI003974A226